MADLNLIPGELNITIASRNDLPISLTVTDSVGDPYSLVGFTFVSEVTNAFTYVKTAISIVETNLAGGVVSISLTDTQLVALGKGIHKWYFKWNDGTYDFVAVAGSFDVRIY